MPSIARSSGSKFCGGGEEMVFVPHTNQLKETPAQYRARCRKDSK